MVRKRSISRFSGSPSQRAMNSNGGLILNEEKVEEEISDRRNRLSRFSRSQFSSPSSSLLPSSTQISLFPPLPLFSISISSLAFRCKNFIPIAETISISSPSSPSPIPSRVKSGQFNRVKTPGRSGGESEWELLASFSFYNAGDDPVEVTIPRSLLRHLVCSHLIFPFNLQILLRVFLVIYYVQKCVVTVDPSDYEVVLPKKTIVFEITLTPLPFDDEWVRNKKYLFPFPGESPFSSGFHLSERIIRKFFIISPRG